MFPPWIINFLIQWNGHPLKWRCFPVVSPMPFSSVHNAWKFFAVLGAISANNSKIIWPTHLFPKEYWVVTGVGGLTLGRVWHFDLLVFASRFKAPWGCRQLQPRSSCWRRPGGCSVLFKDGDFSYLALLWGLTFSVLLPVTVLPLPHL